MACAEPACSIPRNPALALPDRLAITGVIAFYGVNGRRLTLTNDEAYGLVIAVSDGTLDNVEDIANRLGRATEAR
jgi:death-on-curing protein